MDLLPWSINGAHIVVCDSSLDVTNLQIDFSHSCFWVQAHGVLPKFFTEENTRSIGEEIGKFLESQFKAEEHIFWSRYIQNPAHYLSQKLVIPESTPRGGQSSNLWVLRANIYKLSNHFLPTARKPMLPSLALATSSSLLGNPNTPLHLLINQGTIPIDIDGPTSHTLVLAS
ncbi:hypothetical protein PanWU01x14_093320 [Parasponia andersonii]|uniref:Uncharacterized protein n=1 Tax=Parasponia andersonii TaxID=3476 RepID=A0A2P5D608_PARAD|nr:hypothetical protein PanWU01x14_093320 [Parasponia andersonii]